MRIGPKMQIAVEIVERNPGCSILFVARRLHFACAGGKNNALGYNPVHRAIEQGLIRAEKDGNRYKLFYSVKGTEK